MTGAPPMPPCAPAALPCPGCGQAQRPEALADHIRAAHPEILAAYLAAIRANN